MFHRFPIQDIGFIYIDFFSIVAEEIQNPLDQMREFHHSVVAEGRQIALVFFRVDFFQEESEFPFFVLFLFQFLIGGVSLQRLHGGVVFYISLYIFFEDDFAHFFPFFFQLLSKGAQVCLSAGGNFSVLAHVIHTDDILPRIEGKFRQDRFLQFLDEFF